MLIGQNKILENSALNAKYNLEVRLCKNFKGMDWANNQEIEKVMVTAKNNKNNTNFFRK